MCLAPKPSLGLSGWGAWVRTGKPTGAARGLGRAGRREDPVRSMPTVLPLRAGPDPAALAAAARALGLPPGRAPTEALLRGDLRALGCASLPAGGLGGLHGRRLPSRALVQVEEAVDVGKPATAKYEERREHVRCLKLLLSDGEQTVVGVEFTSCPALPSVPVPGTKLVLDAPLVRHGALLLESGTVAVLGGEVPGLVAAARRASESWVKHVGWRNYKGGESKSLDELVALAREAAWEGRGPEGPSGRAEVLDLCDDEDEGDDEETPPGGAAGGVGGGPDARTAKRARRAGPQQAAAPPPAALAPSRGGGAELRRAIEAASQNPEYCATVTVQGAHIRGITGMNDAGAAPAPSTDWRVSVTIEDGTSCVEADLAPEVTAQHFIRVARGVFESWPPARQEEMSKGASTQILKWHGVARIAFRPRQPPLITALSACGGSHT